MSMIEGFLDLMAIKTGGDHQTLKWFKKDSGKLCEGSGERCDHSLRRNWDTESA